MNKHSGMFYFPGLSDIDCEKYTGVCTQRVAILIVFFYALVLAHSLLTLD